MLPIEMTNSVYWVGVQNPSLRVYDVIWRTERGTSYNSYLIQGSGKTAVIDAVKEEFANEQLAAISRVCDPASIDYIVCNHAEPDHSGSLLKLLEAAPSAAVVCAKPANAFLRSILNTNFDCMVVEDGDTLELGGKTLRFMAAPFLHWPDTMMTYLTEDAVLFSGDIFGCHYSHGLHDQAPPSQQLSQLQKDYFDALMSPFKSYALAAVKKVRGLHIDMIGPSHGPVLAKAPWDVVDRYEQWASDGLIGSDPQKVYIGFVSCYGYTRELAQSLAKPLINAGFDVDIEDISTADSAACAAKIHAADAFAVGSPTVNHDALKPVWDVLSSVSVLVVKNKPAAAFGSFGWSGESIKLLSERLRALGADVVGTCSAKLRPDEKELEEASRLGEALCGALEKRNR